MIEGNTANFAKGVLEAPGTVLVDFNADWCGPCQALHPILEEVSQDLSEGEKIVSVNIDDNPELAEEYGVSSIPCLVVFREGAEVDRNVGLVSARKIKKMMGV